MCGSSEFMYLGEKDYRDKVPFSSHQIKEIYSQYDMIVDNNLYNVAEEIWV